MKVPRRIEEISIRQSGGKFSTSRRRYLTEEDVRVVLERLPRILSERLEKVVFRDCWGRKKRLGYTLTRSRRDIALCNLPLHLSLGAICRQSGVSPEEFGAPLRGQWPPLAIRRFQLYDVLLHEIGHLQVIHPKHRDPNRKFADEKEAESFAMDWRQKLWAEPCSHLDPAHHPPEKEEIQLVRTNWMKAHELYKGALKKERELSKRSGFIHGRDDLEAAVALFPAHSLALQKLGQCYFVDESQEGNFERAFDCFQRARMIDPCLGNNLLYGGICLSRLGREEEAREWLGQAILFDQYAPISRAVFAGELSRMGCMEESKRLFKAILRQKPNDSYTRGLYKSIFGEDG